MLKTVEQVIESLGFRYNGPTEKVNGYSYIPWNTSAQIANEVFGPLGWSSKIGYVRECKDGSGYESLVTVTATMLVDGTPFTVSKDGAGFSEIRETRDGRSLRDTAYKAAASDAFSRAVKMFGNAFGLFLYSGEETSTSEVKKPQPLGGETSTRNTSQKAQTNRGPSEKQAAILRKNGIPSDVVEEVNAQTASKMIEMLFAGTSAKSVLTKTGYGSSGSVALLDEDDDDM